MNAPSPTCYEYCMSKLVQQVAGTTIKNITHLPCIYLVELVLDIHEWRAILHLVLTDDCHSLKGRYMLGQFLPKSLV